MKEIKSWYTKGKNKTVEIPNSSEHHIVEYDVERGMYRVSIFGEDNHWQDEFWFEKFKGE